ncbi:hypothetical protein HER15_14285 [Tenacibaculum mesophilum]|uniref:Uncharacterized protein n=1 Tax=Tenacibaculum mesophilum TaxID=104268 RepID=A0AAE9SI68_9FLAO|nr:hypothetical protein [Tenacibaculum mesophilum]UTD16574.1 hypothetical protein HER15_14285 [Tenacibaculum mesophilum]
MKIPEILFEDIIIESKYNLFKLIFISHDLGFTFDNFEDDVNGDVSINVNEVIFSKDNIYFENTEQEYVASEEISEIRTYNFLKDYFSPAVKNICKNYIKYLHDYIKENAIYGNEAKVDFYNLCIFNLKKIFIKTSEITFLSELERDLIVEQIAECQDYVVSLKLNIENKEKIPFTLNNRQLTALFYLLRNHNVIDRKLTNPELGELMQNHLYYSSEKPLVRASKYLYGLDKDINKKTLDKLKDVFRDIFFKK